MPHSLFFRVTLLILIAPLASAQSRPTGELRWPPADTGGAVEMAPVSVLDSVAAAPPGLLVMAHGGSGEWNDAVQAAVAPLRQRRPTTIAFGMADPHTLAQALDSLRVQGVGRVAVVRLFMDGDSFRHQTEYLLGLREDPPAEFVLHGSGHGTPAPLRHGLEIALSQRGLMEAEEVASILAARAQGLSEAPADEAVLVLAHGAGDEIKNAHWVVAMERLSGPLRRLGFHSVRVETLREDWPERRAEAERRIRAFVEAEAESGHTVLVVPFRLFGFGPYREVLDGLTFRAADTGLLPHGAVTDWLDTEYRALAAREGWTVPAP